jgi:N-acetylglucosamine-6-phosphate deacetylase
LPVCVGNAVRHAGASLSDAVRMVTSNPSRLLGLPIDAGHERLQIGSVANLTVFRGSPNDTEVKVVKTVVAGQVVHDADAG